MPATKRTPEETLREFDRLPDGAKIDINVLALYEDVSVATAWRRVKAGLLPPPVMSGNRATRWEVGQLRKRRSA